MQQATSSRKREPTAFSVYLRTGRRVVDRRVEVKFNPWHDPADGRFTFAGRGSFYPAGRGGEASVGDQQNSSSKERQDRANYFDPNYTDARASAKRNDPRNPQNYSIYVVRPGDNLTRIARFRKGLTAADLAWLNEVPLDRPLQIGQRIKVPHQRSLDEGKRDRDAALALLYYKETHRGELPPIGYKVPSVEKQIERQVAEAGLQRITANNYAFDLDILSRMQRLTGEVPDGPVAKRSRSVQLQAGGRDRLPTDHGGHYIASRFNGPAAAFNHFAQDAKFNQGDYAKMENEWAAAKRAGKRVFVDIRPEYRGLSLRPSKIVVRSHIDGKFSIREFKNESSSSK